MLTLGCGSGSNGNHGSAGSAGTGGSAGTAGTAGAAGSDSGVGGSAGGGTGGVAGDAGTDAPVGPPPYDVNFDQRQPPTCAFGPGDKTTTTIGPNVPHGDALPFDHIVVLMMENRSFDQYFSKLPEYGVTDVDVATDNDFNYDPDTNPPSKIYRYHESRYCIVDTDHEWTAVHLQYDQGAMDGFVATNNPGGGRAMGYYDDTDLPYYYWLAKTFAISDTNFSSLLGPTWPNRFYFYGATSWGHTKTGDITVPVDSTVRNGTRILDLMDNASRSWKIYRDGSYSFAIVFKQTLSYQGSSMTTFDSDVDNDTLPDLAIIDPDWSKNDEHPPHNVQDGQQLTKRVLDKLMSNPAVWQKTVFFLMYDEHGGIYDHVPPPAACEPDNYLPPDYAFDRLGIRTPLVVVSPYVRPGYVSHLVTDHTSVTRFIENRFDLPAMTYRDANAWPLLDMFDFSQMSFPTPPSGAPDATLDPAGAVDCPNGGTGTP